MEDVSYGLALNCVRVHFSSADENGQNDPVNFDRKYNIVEGVFRKSDEYIEKTRFDKATGLKTATGALRAPHVGDITQVKRVIKWHLQPDK